MNAQSSQNYLSDPVGSQPNLSMVGGMMPPVKQVRQVRKLNEYEKHAGWLENVRTEKNTVIK